MSRCDRIINRRAWFSDVGNMHRKVSRTKDYMDGRVRKSFKRLFLEWVLFRTHDDKKVEAGIKAMKEAKAAADAERAAAAAGITADGTQTNT